MSNAHILNRLSGIQMMLIGVHQSGVGLSNASKGAEREAFVDSFLSQVLPPPYRFGSGDATDKNGRRSGQLDVVVEYPFSPSLPVVGGGSRLFLAEGIASVVEVKSDLSGQWSQVEKTAANLRAVEREFGGMMSIGPGPSKHIPLFAVGYKGWSSIETLKKKLELAPVDGILVIDPGLFVSVEEFRGIGASGPLALWGLIVCLHQASTTLQAAYPDPLSYAT